MVRIGGGASGGGSIPSVPSYPQTKYSQTKLTPPVMNTVYTIFSQSKPGRIHQLFIYQENAETDPKDFDIVFVLDSLHFDIASYSLTDEAGRSLVPILVYNAIDDATTTLLESTIVDIVDNPLRFPSLPWKSSALITVKMTSAAGTAQKLRVAVLYEQE